MKRKFDLAITGGTIVPMTENGLFFRGDLLTSGGEIREITHGAARDYDAETSIDASDGLVIPGLIQCHVHVVQSLLRHHADGLELLDWLMERTWPYEAALDGNGVEAAARLGIAELLCGGTTTVLDFGTTHDHGRVFAAAENMGIRMCSGKTHMDDGEGVPAGLLEELEASLAEAEELGKRWHGTAQGRLEYVVTPRFALSCTREMLKGCVELAGKHGWMLHTHASENRGEIEEVRRRFGCSNIEFLRDMGLTGDRVVLAHGVHLSEMEREILAGSGTRICHCPGANLKLASGIADVPAMLRAGICVGLGADGPPCNNRLSVFQEMSLAGTLHCLRDGPRALDAWDVLAMATREGARLLHKEESIGTLETGKLADITVVDTRGWSMIPGGEPASQLVHGATADSVRHVVVNGQLRVFEGRLKGQNEDEIRLRAEEEFRATWARMEV